MQCLEARRLARQQLAAAGIAEAEREATLLAAYLVGVEPGQLALHLNAPVEKARLQALLTRRIAGQPLQYVLEEAGFMGLVFTVGPGVLIPRPDTEIIAERAIALLSSHPTARIADIGTGSGALAVSLAYYLPRAEIHAVDISSAALAYAKTNAQANGVAKRCCFYLGDLLSPLSGRNLSFDLIISNPPYITRAEMAELPAELSHEPELALYGGEDGLELYRRLAVEAAPLLAPGGRLLLEHGWQQQLQLVGLLTSASWQVTERLTDYGGRPRGLLATKLR